MFDVAVGERAISHMGHIKMMGAVQPFISGAISKTVNLPEDSTVDDIMDAYMEGWRLGLKALAIYRDGSKTAQALRTEAQEKKGEAVGAAGAGAAAPPPAARARIAHAQVLVAGHEGYITAGKYEDGSLGEIFLTDIGKDGSTLRGMMNAFATAISIGLQYGVPLETFVRKFSYMRFDPEGMTTNPEIPFAKSLPDYIMRWLASRFLDPSVHEELGIMSRRGPCPQAGRGDRSPPTNGGNGHPGNGGQRPPEGEAKEDAAESKPADLGADRHATGRPGQDHRPRPRPGVLPVRRHDAAHRLLLHLLELRQQHRLRVGLPAFRRGSSRAHSDHQNRGQARGRPSRVARSSRVDRGSRRNWA